jgi:hypothetical protein
MLNINNIVYQLPIEVDTVKILKELETLVLPNFKKDVNNVYGASIGLNITNIKNTPIDNWYNTRTGNMDLLKDMDTGEELTKSYPKYTLGFPGEWRNNVEAFYSTGSSDKDFIYWHPDLIDGEIYRLNNKIAEHFDIDNNLRCRASFCRGSNKVNFHSDPHTPWRVHVNLKSNNGATWRFRSLESDETIEWIQPLDSLWLIRTGNVQHSIEVDQDDIRWQLFYHIWQSNLPSPYHFTQS